MDSKEKRATYSAKLLSLWPLYNDCQVAMTLGPDPKALNCLSNFNHMSNPTKTTNYSCLELNTCSRAFLDQELSDVDAYPLICALR